jgi:hypothetical protein
MLHFIKKVLVPPAQLCTGLRFCFQEKKLLRQKLASAAELKQQQQQLMTDHYY